MCRKSLVEPGSQAEQAQVEEDLNLSEWSNVEFRPGETIDFRRVFSAGEASDGFNRAFNQPNRDESSQPSREESRESHSDYAGMYS